jgi:hypothetical protein
MPAKGSSIAWGEGRLTAGAKNRAILFNFPTLLPIIVPLVHAGGQRATERMGNGGLPVRRNTGK